MARHEFRILSIDGGGIKGIIPCTILQYIEKKTGQRISSLFNLLAGTSTGGIISVGLTKPDDAGAAAFSADDMRRLYVDNGKHIFSKRPSDFKSWIGSLIQKGLFDKAFDVRQFEAILQQRFGEVRLKEALADVLVTTYEPEEEKPFYFSSRLAKQDAKENILLREIARSTSAAPTYFKPSRVSYNGQEKLKFVDGGVFANNPSILAYSEAKELWKQERKTMNVAVPDGTPSDAKTFEAVVTPDDNDYPFLMLSVGCGHSPSTIDYDEVDTWRSSNWIKPLLTSVFMQSVAESTDYTMKHLLPPFEDKTPRYIRLDLELPEENSQMDDASNENIQALCKIADAFVAANTKKLDEVCFYLMQ